MMLMMMEEEDKKKEMKIVMKRRRRRGIKGMKNEKKGNKYKRKDRILNKNKAIK